MNFLVGKQIPQRLGNAHPNVVPYRDFAAADDYLLVACGNDSQFQSLCRVLDRHDLAEDPRYTNNAGRNQYRRELEVSLAKSISTWSAADLLQAMQKAGVPGGPINNIAQMLDDPHIQARQLLQPLVRADGSTVMTLAYPAKFSRTPPTYRMAPPRLGQDTECLLKERLDLSTEQIQLLATTGVIGGPFQPI
jgi:crotonobetainyl-CoA:carnitine CoA-transferase CaiB-like acyl-CoA transferase